MSKLRGKGVLVILTIVVVIFSSVFWSWKTLEARGRENGLRSAAHWTDDFHKHQQVYEALVRQWGQI